MGIGWPCLVGVLLSAAPALADDSKSQAPVHKKAEYLAAKAAAKPIDEAAWQKSLSGRIGKPPTPLIIIVNTWTDEVLAVDDVRGTSVAQDQVNRFLRCHFTNEPAQMDARLFPTLLKAAQHFRSRRIEIVSGFRAPKYNLMLRKKGRQVARNSQHTHGKAVDFRLKGVSTKRLRDWARSLRLGGVGYYTSSRFIHVDTGPVRTWSGR